MANETGVPWGSGLPKDRRGDTLGTDGLQFVTCRVVAEGEAVFVSVL